MECEISLQTHGWTTIKIKVNYETRLSGHTQHYQVQNAEHNFFPLRP